MSVSINTAMVLAAGMGQRMRPLTNTIPKPLISVRGKPLLDYALDRFARSSVARAVVNIHYLADQVETHLNSRSVPEIILSDERDQLLETGGALIKARTLFDNKPIFCTNTDAILVDKGAGACELLADNWQSREMDALLLLCPITAASGYSGRGDFVIEGDGRLCWPGDAPSDVSRYIFTGLQIIHPRLFEAEPLRPVSTKLFWDRAKAAGRLYGVVYDGQWMHVGDPEGLKEAEHRLASVPANLT